MPFIDIETLRDRIKSPNNIQERPEPVTNLRVFPIVRRRPTDVETPIEIKKTLSILAGEGEGQRSLAKVFGVSQPSVGLYERGLADMNGTVNEELSTVVQSTKDKNEQNRTRAEEKALDSLVASLDLVSERLPTTKSLKTIASVAKTMSEIAGKVSGREETQSNVQVHLYMPKMKADRDYEVIDV